LAEAVVVKTQKQQVAQLVARPMEIVEYQRQHCQCVHCGQVSASAWDAEMLPGQDLGIKLQSLLGWLGNYAHLPYEKQQELLWELGEIEVGVGTLVSTNQRVPEGIVPAVTQLETKSKQVLVLCSLEDNNGGIFSNILIPYPLILVDNREG
jgi:transposase